MTSISKVPEGSRSAHHISGFFRAVSSPSSGIGTARSFIASLFSKAEHDTVLSKRQDGFVENSMILSSERLTNPFYDNYGEQCNVLTIKAMQQRTFIAKLFETLSNFKIFMNSGRELGREDLLFLYFQPNSYICRGCTYHEGTISVQRP